MKLLDIIITANHSLLRNKARTILTIIAIFIGATTLSLTNGIGAGIKTYLNKQSNNLGNSYSLQVNATTKSSSPGASDNRLTKYTPGEKKVIGDSRGPSSGAQIALTEADIQKIESVPNIVSVEPNYTVTPDYIALSAQTADKYQFSLNQTIGKSNLDMAAGTTVSNSDTTNEITIPTSYVSSLGYTDNAAAVGKTVTIAISDATGKQTAYQATIVGVQQKTLVGSSSAYANDALFKTLYNTASTGLPASTKD